MKLLTLIIIIIIIAILHLFTVDKKLLHNLNKRKSAKKEEI